MTERPLRSFAARLTVAYVTATIAVALVIGGISTLITFTTYASASNEIVTDATRTLERRLAYVTRHHIPFATAAPQMVADLARPRIRVSIYDAQHRLIAGGPEAFANPLANAAASLMNLQTAHIAAPDGGLIVIRSDPKRLADMLAAYWTIMTPAVLLAILAAWIVGRSITRAALAPLAHIASALRRFAGGDLHPEPIAPSGDGEIAEIAHAYNGAVYQLASALAERDRSEAQIRQFIADAGHELRTPLTVVMGYLDILDTDGVDPAMRTRIVASMRQESRRMRALIEKLIFLARLERGDPTHRDVVDVGDVVARVVAAFEPLGAAERIDVDGVAHATVVADESEIFEALRNLVDNAVKYAPDSRVGIATAREAGEVVVAVSDRGPGMSEQDRAHAFDRFYRGDHDGVEGSGLGLAIARRAVQRANGSIAVHSALGAGTTFTVRLPRVGANDPSEA
ncbi:MAG: HAMP domain-containing sensor histidine kinase [Vulcanimicrobiaceae bacterium]|jgi:two-component system OmpR family sensor kinase